MYIISFGNVISEYLFIERAYYTFIYRICQPFFAKTMYKVYATFLCNMAEMLPVKTICTLFTDGDYKENAVYRDNGVESVYNV